jgi:hypothetical protein
MKESLLSDKVILKLKDFETMERIQASTGWNESLMARLESRKPDRVSNIPAAGFVVSLLFIVLINLGFVLTSIINNSNPSYKEKDMQVISQELLINPISIKY